MKNLDPHKWYEFPHDVAVCPICGAGVIVGDFDEWETETGRVTESGFHVDCVTEPDFDDPDYDDWFNSHWSMPYVDWLPLEIRLYKWFDQRYRLSLITQREDDYLKARGISPTGENQSNIVLLK
jgi:hypothetical protein